MQTKGSTCGKADGSEDRNKSMVNEVVDHWVGTRHYAMLQQTGLTKILLSCNEK